MPRIIEFQEIDTDQNTRWNPVTGCTPNSRGCAHCYALERAEQMRFDGISRYSGGFTPTEWPDRLRKDFNSLRPSRIFVNSMSDLFHEAVSDEFIGQVFNTIYLNPRHLFLVLTKRAERMHGFRGRYSRIRNLLLGVTVEHTDYIDRIRLLQETDARYKVIFFEPLLCDMGELNLAGINWAFVGGESLEGCRPMSESWVWRIKEQCEAQGCTFVFKGWGGVNRFERAALLRGRYYDNIPTVENCLP